MMKHIIRTSVAACLICAAGIAGSASDVPDLRLTPDEISQMTGVGHVTGAATGTAGVAAAAKITVLQGDPRRPGPYTIALYAPPNMRIAPHFHRDDRSAVVVSGTVYVGYGTRAADQLLKALKAGSFYTEPAGRPHFAQTRDEAALVYITGQGPSDTVYVPDDSAPR